MLQTYGFSKEMKLCYLSVKKKSFMHYKKSLKNKIHQWFWKVQQNLY